MNEWLNDENGLFWLYKERLEARAMTKSNKLVSGIVKTTHALFVLIVSPHRYLIKVFAQKNVDWLNAHHYEFFTNSSFFRSSVFLAPKRAHSKRHSGSCCKVTSNRTPDPNQEELTAKVLQSFIPFRRRSYYDINGNKM